MALDSSVGRGRQRERWARIVNTMLAQRGFEPIHQSTLFKRVRAAGIVNRPAVASYAKPRIAFPYTNHAMVVQDMVNVIFSMYSMELHFDSKSKLKLGTHGGAMGKFWQLMDERVRVTWRLCPAISDAAALLHMCVAGQVRNPDHDCGNDNYIKLRIFGMLLRRVTEADWALHVDEDVLSALHSIMPTYTKEKFFGVRPGCGVNLVHIEDGTQLGQNGDDGKETAAWNFQDICEFLSAESAYFLDAEARGGLSKRCLCLTKQEQ